MTPRTRPTAAALLGGAIALLAMTACDYTRVEVATQGGTAACEDVPGVIAARTFACEADHDLANRRYDDFRAAYRCVQWDPVTTPYEELWHCSFEVGQLPCERVEDYGDDLDRWLGVSPACALLLERPDGTPLPGGIDRREAE